jgi:hypothetical protein
MDIERDWLDVSSPNKAPLALYLVEVLTYGVTHPIKIGVSKNVPRRVKQLRAMGISCPRLLGYFQFSSASEARRVEAETRKAFPPCPNHGDCSREILAAPAKDICAFVQERAPGAFIPTHKSMMQ